METMLSFSCISYFAMELILLKHLTRPCFLTLSKEEYGSLVSLQNSFLTVTNRAVSLEATVTPTGVVTLVDSCAGGINITEWFVPAIKLGGHGSLAVQFICFRRVKR